MSKIWLKSPATQWNEALPVGGGMLGAMVFGQPMREHLQINEDSLWSGGFRDRLNPSAREELEEVRRLLMEGRGAEAETLAKRAMVSGLSHMPHYETMGDVWIDLSDPSAPKKVVHTPEGMPLIVPEVPAIEEYHRSLDLATSLGSVSYRANGAQVRGEFFVSHPANVVVYHLESDQPISLAVSLSRRVAAPGRSCSFCEGIEAVDTSTLRLWGHNGDAKGIDYEMACSVRSHGDTVRSIGANVLVEGATTVTVLVCGRTSFRSEDPHAWCMDHLRKISEKTYDELRSEAVADYRGLHDRFELDFPIDEVLEALPTNERLARIREGKSDVGLVQTYVEFGRYLLISSSREGSLPSNLQGIWNGEFDPMWGSKYTVNINTQMNYWLAERAGLGDLHLPLFDHLERMVPHGRDVAQRMYGARGWMCHHNTDIWGDCVPQDSNTAATIWPMGGAWLSTHIAEHWRHTHDFSFARRMYPVLRDSVLFFYGLHGQGRAWSLADGPVHLT